MRYFTKHDLTQSARFACALLLFFLPATPSAGGILENIRSADLNDFALGLNVSVSQNPYIGTKSSVIVFPYLTSFNPMAFTDDWLIFHGGDIGLRKVTANNWEFGAVARIETLGFGSEESEELLGLSDRQWTVEMAPFVGYRGWPVHIKYKAYKEVSGRHGGVSQELAFSYPVQRSWGYIIPYLEILHLDDDYTDYYFQVTDDESRPGRPAYDPGAATNKSAVLELGYQLADKWLISGRIRYELLDDTIVDSPIVDKDTLWSWSLGVAYNADVFRNREFDENAFRMPRFEIRAGIFKDNINTTITPQLPDGSEGPEIDIEEQLGISNDQSVLQLDALLRLGQYHRLEFGYFELVRDSTFTLENDVQFGDEIFDAGTSVNAKSNFQITRLAYAFSLINDAQKEIGVMAGVHVSKIDTEIGAPDTGQQVESSASTPLPVIGIHGNLALGTKTYLGARVHIFRMHFDHYEGSMNYLNLSLQHMFNQNVSVGLGYNFYSLNLDSDNVEINGNLQIRHHGPVVFVGAHF